jgi:hypothetical protein
MMKRAGLSGRSAGACVALVALMAFGAGRVDAQVRVEGEALDKLTGLPVQGVIVQFPDLGLATITDSLGYFIFDAVPRGTQILTTYHFGYRVLQAETPVVLGDLLEIRLTPRPISLSGVAVDVRPREEVEALTMGRRSDFISPEEIEEMANRTNKVLEVLRTKAPPRLQIRQQGGAGGITFCIQSSRPSPSVQELKDLGIGCKPSMLIMDGVVIYAPPSTAEMVGMQAATMPDDVAYMLLNQDPSEIESIRVLSPSDAFFRYGDAGRLGAVEVKTKRPFKTIR